MMRSGTAFAVVVMVALFAGCAGMRPVAETDRTFEGIFEAPGATKDQIYSATKMWIAENFRSAKAVIEYDNKDDGTLIGNGIIPYSCSGMGCLGRSKSRVPFTMRVDADEGRFRLTFSNLRLTWPMSYLAWGALPPHDGPLTTQGDYDTVKPILLAFGPSIADAIRQGKVKKDW
jgi:hypothetical protein